MQEPIFPGAKVKELVNHSVPGTIKQKNTIILHITAGSTMEGAYQTFAKSVSPKRVSCHFIIDRDGTVYQLLPISDVAWHASQSNAHSVGIEHVAIPNTLLCTDAQYKSSAELVAWLCKQLGIKCDRNHVRTHHECSPRDGHVLCCTGALNPDTVVSMAAELK